MKQEDKQLLLKDLCRRLPYGVKVTTTNPAVKIGIISGISIKNKISVETKHANIVFDCTEVKPYLRPMSSMTEEEKREIYNWLVENDVDWFDFSKLRLDEILISFDSSWLLINWLNEHHFDYHGLIEKGLALEASSEMYNQ